VCENPPVFEPIFYQAAALARSLVVAPLFLGDMVLGHEETMRRPMLVCAPQPALCHPAVQPHPYVVGPAGAAAARLAGYPPQGGFVPTTAPVRPERAGVPVCVPTGPQYSPFPK
jgi:hypothetical protein